MGSADAQDEVGREGRDDELGVLERVEPQLAQHGGLLSRGDGDEEWRRGGTTREPPAQACADSLVSTSECTGVPDASVRGVRW